MAYLLWFTLVLGGLFMGGGAVWAQMQHGADLVLTLNAVAYLASAVYAMPRLWSLLRSQLGSLLRSNS